MDYKDFSKINKIMCYFEPNAVGIKIINDKPSMWVCKNFKKDLELFNSIGGDKKVSRVLIYGDCFARILTDDNDTPLVYYFSTEFGEVESAICRIRKVCNDLDIDVEEMDPNLI